MFDKKNHMQNTQLFVSTDTLIFACCRVSVDDPACITHCKVLYKRMKTCMMFISLLYLLFFIALRLDETAAKLGCDLTTVILKSCCPSIQYPIPPSPPLGGSSALEEASVSKDVARAAPCLKDIPLGGSTIQKQTPSPQAGVSICRLIH